jgi:L-threonylcarbamoyladenylate synthase
MRISLDTAIQLLLTGKVVAIPTETVYGLAADARNEDALRQIYAIKERPANNPLIVHIANVSHVNDWASAFPPIAQQLAQAFWPGPLTLVLPAHHHVSSIVRAGEPTVALRVPAHPLTQQLLTKSGLGLAAPSANKYTQLSPTSPTHVAGSLGDDIPILDGGTCQVGIESTIVSVNEDEWQLLRHGMISQASITDIAGKPATPNNLSTPKAPGQHLLHYAPKTPTQLFSQRDALIQHCQHRTRTVALLIGNGSKPPCQTIQLPSNPHEVAELLYDSLHQLDAMGADEILIELPPDTQEWLAIRDRLCRAGYRTQPHSPI